MRERCRRRHRWLSIPDEGYSCRCDACGTRMVLQDHRVVGYELADGTFVKGHLGGPVPRCPSNDTGLAPKESRQKMSENEKLMNHIAAIVENHIEGLATADESADKVIIAVSQHLRATLKPSSQEPSAPPDPDRGLCHLTMAPETTPSVDEQERLTVGIVFGHEG